MLASTSRAGFWQSTGLIQSSSFSSTARCPARRRVLVELLEDVANVGKKFDKELVKPGYARHYLVPLRKARLVAASPVQKYHPESLVDRILNAHRDVPFYDSDADPSLYIPAPRKSRKNQKTRAEEHDAQVSVLLADVPPVLEFALRTIAPNDPAVHGSVTLSDVAERLAVEHDLLPADFRVYWEDEAHGAEARIKELGTWVAVVEKKTGREEKRHIDIKVVRLKETQPAV
ncbi:hypothetical protein BCR39DRAFT_531653 [Naematelia encephala]|uniref:Ribosomal protein L9 domain-containing protein n=1 Tax=Naematelia encephala TaxID=71784 RepID=A0A1Y2B4C4_9TREE|nr:hypothetical protein BCR39DRAFT_531653 [Naematelia encephala]